MLVAGGAGKGAWVMGVVFVVAGDGGVGTTVVTPGGVGMGVMVVFVVAGDGGDGAVVVTAGGVGTGAGTGAGAGRGDGAIVVTSSGVGTGVGACVVGGFGTGVGACVVGGLVMFGEGEGGDGGSVEFVVLLGGRGGG